MSISSPRGDATAWEQVFKLYCQSPRMPMYRLPQRADRHHAERLIEQGLGVTLVQNGDAPD